MTTLTPTQIQAIADRLQGEAGCGSCERMRRKRLTHRIIDNRCTNCGSIRCDRHLTNGICPDCAIIADVVDGGEVE